MITTKEMLQQLTEVAVQLPDGNWVPALPLPDPLICRIRDAWAVLLGKAQAVRQSR